jgi:hypothetical protein
MMPLYPRWILSQLAPSNAGKIHRFLRVGSARLHERHGSNYIVVRHSPDWLSFDPESSRAFCLKLGMPETQVIDFVSLWDNSVGIDYRQFRFRVKQIAQQNLAKVEGGRIIDDAEFHALALAGKVPPDALAVFVDDDDWLAPDLFVRLRVLRTAGGDGFRWGSVRLGRDFNLSLDANANFELQPTLTLRPIDQSSIYTNNYAVSGIVVRRLGVEAICEAFGASTQLHRGGFAPHTVAQYLSCTNKHPASTVAAYLLLDSEDFRRDPRADIRRWAEGVMNAPLPVDLAWIAAPRKQLTTLLVKAARAR